MNWILSVLLSIAIATLFVSNAVAQAPVDTRRAQLNAVLQEEWEYRLRTNPELASHTGDNRYNARSAISLPNSSPLTCSMPANAGAH